MINDAQIIADGIFGTKPVKRNCLIIGIEIVKDKIKLNKLISEKK